MWLYIAVFDLAGLGKAAAAPDERQEAVRSSIGRLAACAPVCLHVGLQASSERLEAELWERLQFLGRQAAMIKEFFKCTGLQEF